MGIAFLIADSNVMIYVVLTIIVIVAKPGNSLEVRKPNVRICKSTISITVPNVEMTMKMEWLTAAERHIAGKHWRIESLYCTRGPPLWSSGQSSWLVTQRSRVPFPALPDFLSSGGSGTGSTQP
jgi:hypothetical protein